MGWVQALQWSFSTVSKYINVYCAITKVIHYRVFHIMYSESKFTYIEPDYYFIFVLSNHLFSVILCMVC